MAAPDGDNLELHHLQSRRQNAPRVLLLHGLEGRPHSHYVSGVFRQAEERDWGATLMLFRGCGAAENVARRFYHSGETGDVQHVFATLSQRWPESPWLAVAISLGGNVLLKWLGEWGENVDPRIRAAGAVSVPFDLEAGARHISRGFSRIYDRHFVRSLRSKALRKLVRYPDLFDASALARVQSIFEFDDVVTAPVHGFSSATDYYARSSSLCFLERIRTPTLLVSAEDDPFLPAAVLARVKEIAGRNASLTLDFTERGGHVGFVSGRFPWRPRYYAEQRIFRFFDDVMECPVGTRYD